MQPDGGVCVTACRSGADPLKENTRAGGQEYVGNDATCLVVREECKAFLRSHVSTALPNEPKASVSATASHDTLHR